MTVGGYSLGVVVIAAVAFGFTYALLVVRVHERTGDVKWGGYLLGIVSFGGIASGAVFALVGYGLVTPVVLLGVHAHVSYVSTDFSGPGDSFVGLLAVSLTALPVIPLVAGLEYLLRSATGLYPPAPL